MGGGWRGSLNPKPLWCIGWCMTACIHKGSLCSKIGYALGFRVWVDQNVQDLRPQGLGRWGVRSVVQRVRFPVSGFGV